MFSKVYAILTIILTVKQHYLNSECTWSTKIIFSLGFLDVFLEKEKYIKSVLL